MANTILELFEKNHQLLEWRDTGRFQGWEMGMGVGFMTLGGADV